MLPTFTAASIWAKLTFCAIGRVSHFYLFKTSMILRARCQELVSFGHGFHMVSSVKGAFLKSNNGD
jgi:hypothetical protein